MEHLAERFAEVPGVVAVTLGGSRAQGTHRPESDWDFGLYYRDTIDPGDVRELGFSGEVFAPGDWAGFMNGGAFLNIEGVKVDVIYRDLSEVERVTALAADGRFELTRVPGYLVGMASYVLVGEVSLCKVLHGELAPTEFPEALRTQAPGRWSWETDFVLGYAEAHGRRGDVTACAGSLAQAALATGYGRLCARGEWALNDKNVIERAGLHETWSIIGRLGRDPDIIERKVQEVRAALTTP